MSSDAIWQTIVRDGMPQLDRKRKMLRWLPAEPRCKVCYAPFQGFGGTLVKWFLKKQVSRRMPGYCNACDTLIDTLEGGVEVTMTMLFADVRGSTGMAESMNPSTFSRLMNRFYATATQVFIETDAYIDKFVGDEVVGLYVPGFAGPDAARKAVHAAQLLLRGTGHQGGSPPWVPVGVGLHTGPVFFGKVGSQSAYNDVTALGDAMNMAARLASQAKAGEILVSEDTCRAANVSLAGKARQVLQLKGKSEGVPVYILKADSTL